eukprot:gene15785-15941_t
MISALKIYMNNIVPTVISNEPLWSLSFEMFFYLVFMLTIGRYQKRALLAWFIIAIAVLPLYYSSISVGSLGHIFAVIGFSSVWLIGYYLYEFRDYYYTDKYTALFSIGALPLISRMHISTIYYDPVKLLRIYPQFLVGILMGIAALYITNTEFPSLKVITGNFLMLSTMKDEMGHIVPSIQSNLPVWSLSFEMAFYAFFALTIGRFQKKAIAVWFVASLIAIPLFFLKTERDAYRNYFYAGKYAVAFGLGVIKAVYMVVPHLLILAITLKMHYLPIPIAVAYGTFPYLYMGIVYFIDLAGDFSGRFSYPLYITHFPILFVFLSVFNHSVLGFALASIPVALLVTYILEIWFQPAITRFFLAKKKPQVTVVPDIKLTDIQGDIPVKKLKNGMPVPDLID